jgi:hypothetical protein
MTRSQDFFQLVAWKLRQDRPQFGIAMQALMTALMCDQSFQTKVLRVCVTLKRFHIQNHYIIRPGWIETILCSAAPAVVVAVFYATDKAKVGSDFGDTLKSRLLLRGRNRLHLIAHTGSVCLRCQST